MAKAGNRGKQTSTTTGLGSYDLDAVVAATDPGWQEFKNCKGIADGDQIWYVAWDGDVNWEIGKGTLNVGAGGGGKDQLTRDTIEESSAVGDAAVDWGAGTREIWIGAPANEFAVTANNGSDFTTPATVRTNLAVPGDGDVNTFTGTNTFNADVTVASGAKLTAAGELVAPVGSDLW